MDMDFTSSKTTVEFISENSLDIAKYPFEPRQPLPQPEKKNQTDIELFDLSLFACAPTTVQTESTCSSANLNSQLFELNSRVVGNPTGGNQFIPSSYQQNQSNTHGQFKQNLWEQDLDISQMSINQIQPEANLSSVFPSKTYTLSDQNNAINSNALFPAYIDSNAPLYPNIISQPNNQTFTSRNNVQYPPSNPFIDDPFWNNPFEPSDLLSVPEV
ncbi:hypothetical protein HZS_2582 [Henneguya salminicola]|nr:hypothetical protein HZS_2582 [Henneguya salminicola]